MRVLKLKDVLNKTGLGKTTLYALLKQSKFPKPINLGLRAVGWLESEVDAWIQHKVDLRDQQDIATFTESKYGDTAPLIYANI